MRKKKTHKHNTAKSHLNYFSVLKDTVDKSYDYAEQRFCHHLICKPVLDSVL